MSFFKLLITSASVDVVTVFTLTYHDRSPSQHFVSCEHLCGLSWWIRLLMLKLYQRICDYFPGSYPETLRAEFDFWPSDSWQNPESLGLGKQGCMRAHIAFLPWQHTHMHADRILMNHCQQRALATEPCDKGSIQHADFQLEFISMYID